MNDDIDDDSVEFLVVVNDEEQYSIWPAYRALPAGWRAAGVSGQRQRCLDHIDEVWRDIRPLSLRRSLAAVRGATGGTTNDGGEH